MTICILLGCSPKQPEKPESVIADRLPVFEATMNDGSVFSSSDLGGKPLLLIFFNTSCVDCRRTLPHVQKAYDKYSETVSFVAISREQGDLDVAAWWRDNGITIPYSAQKDRSLYELFAKTGIPRVYLADSDGIIRFRYDDSPTPDFAVLDDALGVLVGE